MGIQSLWGTGSEPFLLNKSSQLLGAGCFETDISVFFFSFYLLLAYKYAQSKNKCKNVCNTEFVTISAPREKL